MHCILSFRYLSNSDDKKKKKKRKEKKAHRWILSISTTECNEKAERAFDSIGMLWFKILLNDASLFIAISFFLSCYWFSFGFQLWPYHSGLICCWIVLKNSNNIRIQCVGSMRWLFIAMQGSIKLALMKFDSIVYALFRIYVKRWMNKRANESKPSVR